MTTTIILDDSQVTVSEVGSTGATGAGVPSGGTANQVLEKINATDYNTQWTNALKVNSISFDGGTNILDDYEEGVFTPTVRGKTTAGSPTLSIQNGKYTKVGDLVLCDIYITLSSKGGMVGQLWIGGLPFAIPSGTTTNRANASIGFIDETIAVTGAVQAIGVAGTSDIYFYHFVSNNSSNFTDANMQDDFVVTLSMAYKI